MLIAREKLLRVQKVWGQELILINSPSYCGKILVVKKGFQCSLHYHLRKDETFYLQSGRLLLELNKRRFIMRPGDSCHVYPGDVHRFAGLKKSELFEFSTHHEDKDSYRMQPSRRMMHRRDWKI